MFDLEFNEYITAKSNNFFTIIKTDENYNKKFTLKSLVFDANVTGNCYFIVFEKNTPLQRKKLESFLNALSELLPMYKDKDFFKLDCYNELLVTKEKLHNNYSDFIKEFLDALNYWDTITKETFYVDALDNPIQPIYFELFYNHIERSEGVNCYIKNIDWSLTEYHDHYKDLTTFIDFYNIEY